MDYIELYKKELCLLNLGERTIKCYCGIVKSFIFRFKKSPVNITESEIKDYLLSYNNTNTKEQIIGALSHFYKRVINQPRKLKNIPYPKREHYLPTVLSTNEVHRIIQSIENIKHKAIIQLIYSCGLRISESVNIKINEINGLDRTLLIKSGKGKKDRYVTIPEETLNLLREYYKQYNPKEYLFNGQSSIQYSARSIEQIFKRSLINAGINKKATVHSLRHTRASHLIDHGAPLNYVQEFLGHSNIKTTQIYLHTTKIQMRVLFDNADERIKLSMENNNQKLITNL